MKILRRLPEALRVALHGVPPDEKEIAVFGFHAAAQLMAPVTAAGRESTLSLAEGRLERIRFTSPNAQDRNFKHHAEATPAASTPAVLHAELDDDHEGALCAVPAHEIRLSQLHSLAVDEALQGLLERACEAKPEAERFPCIREGLSAE